MERIPEYLRHGRPLRYPGSIHHPHLIRPLRHHPQIVRNKQDAHIISLLQCLYQIEYLRLYRYIQRRRRLIRDQ